MTIVSLKPLSTIFSTSQASNPSLTFSHLSPKSYLRTVDSNDGICLHRREFLKDIALASVVILGEAQSWILPHLSEARVVEVGAFLPPSPTDPSFVVFKASPNDTPALPAGIGHSCSFLRTRRNFVQCQFQNQTVSDVGEKGYKGEEKERFRWVDVDSNMSEAQKVTISKLPLKMTKRCKAIMKQLICFSSEMGSLSLLLASWVRSMKPNRADWLSVLKELSNLNHPLYLEVAELVLLEESFEANLRDFTKLIHVYAKQNRIQEAENIVLALKSRGIIFDQVILTSLVHMYSKSGNIKLAEETFEEIKLLGMPLDKRSYGSMIMAYIRAGKLNEGEILLQEMDAQQISAGKEVFKALLRAYSMIGDCDSAQRVFNTIQMACIIPDVKLCGLLINAYVESGRTREACLAFQNLRRAGLQPNDKCVALILNGFEKENKINKALDFLIGLEKDGFVLGKEASQLLAAWFRKMGVLKEVELVLKDSVLVETKM